MSKTIIPRQIESVINEDLQSKIVLLSGPRQSGKTTFAKSLGYSFDYLNYDDSEQRLRILSKQWDRDQELVILDELHKMNEWKRFLKGVFDVEGVSPKLLVTGSAKLDVFRKVGDSLAGRFFRHRLHPFDVREMISQKMEGSANEALERIMRFSGFPEPLLAGTERSYRRWRKTHYEMIIQQDLLTLTEIRQIQQIETLIELLRSRVGSPVSYSSLAQDLEVSYKTVKVWLNYLEALYVIFKITPFHKNVARSLLKEPKYYFYDVASVKGDEGVKLENAVACSLLKECHRIEDQEGVGAQLYYLRTRDGEEVDFCITQESIPTHLIEVKLSDETPYKPLFSFQNYLPNAEIIQLVKNLSRESSLPSGLKVKQAASWLSQFSL